jgi:hypothetical protein
MDKNAEDTIDQNGLVIINDETESNWFKSTTAEDVELISNNKVAKIIG